MAFGHLTLDLNVLEQHGFDHLPSHQNPGGSPVQDVCARFQAHLGGEEKQKSAEDSSHHQQRRSRVLTVCVSQSPLLVTLIHF